MSFPFSTAHPQKICSGQWAATMHDSWMVLHGIVSKLHSCKASSCCACSLHKRSLVPSVTPIKYAAGFIPKPTWKIKSIIFHEASRSAGRLTLQYFDLSEGENSEIAEFEVMLLPHVFYFARCEALLDLQLLSNCDKHIALPFERHTTRYIWVRLGFLLATIACTSIATFVSQRIQKDAFNLTARDS